MSDKSATSSIAFVRTETLPELPPPPNQVGLAKWLRENLFSGPVNTILTLLSIAFIALVGYEVVPWFWYSQWFPQEMSLAGCRAENLAAALMHGAEARGVSGLDAIAALPTAEQIPALQAALGDAAAEISGYQGACFAVLIERFWQFVFGFYPSDLYWRPTLAFVLLLVALWPVLFKSAPRPLLALTAVYPVLAYWLIWGGTIWGPLLVLCGPIIGYFIWSKGGDALKQVSEAFGPIIAMVAAILAVALWFLYVVAPLDGLISETIGRMLISGEAVEQLAQIQADLGAAQAALAGAAADQTASIESQIGILNRQELLLVYEYAAPRLTPVESDDLGGFLLSMIIGVVGIVASLPLGIALALGRRSNMIFIRAVSVGFIECMRGVPLITLLFVASTLLAYFLPPGTTFDLILRVCIMVTFFAAAYMAEVIRGGLAALPKGQYEAADAMGLTYWQSMQLIVLPQALKVSIPNIVSTFIGLFKDTTLVIVIGLLDPLGLTSAIRADAAWNGIVWELYGFVALFFFIFCFGMSRYSMYLERKLATDHR